MNEPYVFLGNAGKPTQSHLKRFNGIGCIKRFSDTPTDNLFAIGIEYQ